ncbi:MAG: hypothetical protein M1828_006335 [Chrysothrix sp. TS-e1954]|nr:MAG: hypothetical protein M1828_006335 [Chrysothrix sp. TS-e1954]
MTYNRLRAAETSTKKPPSELTAGEATEGHNLIRSQLQISTWLCLGAMLQCLLFLLPIRTHLACLPAAALLLWRIGDNALMVFGLKRNVYLDGVLHEKFSALYPSADEGGPPASEELCVLHLASRSNHPLGMFAPSYKKISDYFEVMLRDLEANSEEYGWTGGNTYIKSSDRTTSSEVMAVHYFKSMDHLHKFAHSKTHRDGWDWWNRNAGELRHIGIMHEVYACPRASWETIYVNYKPEGFGGTSHAVTGKDGVKRWVSPIVDAKKGVLRSSAGRVGLESTGGGNEKYGPEPYDDV